jgi:carnosine N-methyltransferase
MPVPKPLTYRCISCGGMLPPENQTYTCPSCNHSFLQTQNFPVFVADSEKYINEMYASLRVHQQRTRQFLETNKAQFHLQPKRQAHFEALCHAYEHNMTLYDRLASDIENYIRPELLANCDFSYYRTEPLKGKELNYLIRDWGGSAESEREVEKIQSVLRRLLTQYKAGSDTILFLGSGTGRFAYETAPLFGKTLCTDLSYRMISLFHYLLQGDTLPAYEINDFSNIYHPKDAARLVEAHIKNLVERPGNLHYFISDVQNLPLQDHSVDVVVSIYFIDVLPIENYIRELKRVLKSGGLYLNIGPVGYPGTTFVNHLLPQEIKTVFSDHDFEILHEEQVENTYMKSNVTLSTVIHHNWVLAARNGEAPQPLPSLSEQSVLQLAEPVFIEKKAELSAAGETVHHHRLYNLKGDLYENADLVIEILYALDGKRTLSEIVQAIEQKFHVQLSFSELLPVLEEVATRKMLRIVTP